MTFRWICSILKTEKESLPVRRLAQVIKLLYEEVAASLAGAAIFYCGHREICSWNRGCACFTCFRPDSGEVLRKASANRRFAQETPDEGFLRKTVHWTIFLFSCVCRRRLRPWDAVPHPATFEKVDETFLRLRAFCPAARTRSNLSIRRGPQPPPRGATCPVRPRTLVSGSPHRADRAKVLFVVLVLPN